LPLSHRHEVGTWSSTQVGGGESTRPAASAHLRTLLTVLDDALDLLRCPHCRARLHRSGGVVRCEAGHSFDVARHGYLSLLPGDAELRSADTAAMVAARAAVLGGGRFDPLGDALVESCGDAAATRGCVLDLGAGTGWYLARVLDRLPGRAGLALDLSKHGLRRAARAHPRIAAVACDAWRPLPVRDAVAAVALSVFAPRNGIEIARVLAPGGALVVAAPTDRHLAELVTELGLLSVDARKQQRLAEQLDPHLDRGERGEVEWTMELDRAEVRDLVAMGPSVRHADPYLLDAAIAALPARVRVTGAVSLSVHRRPA
jgi:23S rRNA (guanine745-N1)-methyltransferase